MAKLAFVFPGQGSQSVGMMQPFADSRAVKDVFAEAAEALKQDLWKLVAEGPAEELNSTVNTQPLMLTAGYAVYRAWRDAGGPEPEVVAGQPEEVLQTGVGACAPSPGTPGEGRGEGLRACVSKRRALTPSLSRSTGRGGRE